VHLEHLEVDQGSEGTLRRVRVDTSSRGSTPNGWHACSWLQFASVQRSDHLLDDLDVCGRTGLSAFHWGHEHEVY
jgi:hypothetical protein